MGQKRCLPLDKPFLATLFVSGSWGDSVTCVVVVPPSLPWRLALHRTRYTADEPNFDLLTQARTSTSTPGWGCACRRCVCWTTRVFGCLHRCGAAALGIPVRFLKTNAHGNASCLEHPVTMGLARAAACMADGGFFFRTLFVFVLFIAVRVVGV